MIRRLLVGSLIVVALAAGFAPAAHAQYTPTTDGIGGGEIVQIIGDEPLPRTGVDVFDYVRVGIVLVTVGGFLILAARRRMSVVQESA